MFSKFLMGICCAFSFIGTANAIKFEKTIGRISYTLNSETKTASINKVFSFWEEDSKLFLPAFVEYDDTFFKVTDASEDAFKALFIDITETNIPHTIKKNEKNKRSFSRLLKTSDEVSKKTIEDYFQISE